MLHTIQDNREKGFTLIELLLVIVIISIVATIVVYNLPSERATQALSNNEDDVVSLLNEARSRTLSGDGALQYGVHLEANRAVLFPGTTFVDGASSTKEVDFDSQVSLSNISLAGTTSNVVFQKISGATDEYGTLVLSNSDTTPRTKTITISKTGLVSGN